MGWVVGTVARPKLIQTSFGGALARCTCNRRFWENRRGLVFGWLSAEHTNCKTECRMVRRLVHSLVVHDSMSHSSTQPLTHRVGAHWWLCCVFPSGTLG